MKPVDLQLSVRKSTDVARTHHTRDKAADTTIANVAAGFRKDLEQRQARVAQSQRAANERIEDGEHGGGGGGGGEGHHDRNSGKKDDEKARDPKKGHIVDITAGFLD